MAHTTEIRTLLAAARRGDFTALLAAADYWQEAGCREQLRLWDMLLKDTRWVIGRGERNRRVKLGPMEHTSRIFRQFARKISPLHGNCWKIPKPWPSQAREWCRDMAFALLKYVKALDASRAPTETDS
jgi:hypothetical protein